MSQLTTYNAAKLPADYVHAGDINPDTGNPYSWFGRAWRNAAIAINRNKALVLSVVGGGGIGGILVALIEAGVSVLVSGRIYLDEITDDFLLTPEEQKRLNYYYKEEILPTILNIVKTVDQSIVLTLQRSKTANDLIVKINNALQDIAILKAYGTLIDSEGLQNTSKNYSRQVSALFVKICDYSEKAIIIYAEKNIYGYKLIEEKKEVTRITQVGGIATYFSKQTISTIKKYVTKETVLDTVQTEITEINTDPTDPTPVTTATQTPTTPTTPTKDENNPSKNNVLRNILIAIGLVGTTYAITKNK